MAISRTQSASSYPSSTITLTTTAGSLLYAMDSGNATTDSATVSRNGGGETWVAKSAVAGSGTTAVVLKQHYCLVANGGSSTWTLGTQPSDSGWSIHEYSWGGSTGTFDQESIRDQTSTANPSTASVTPAANGAALVGALADEGRSEAPTFTGSWSAAVTAEATHYHWTTDQIQGTAASVALTTTRGSSPEGCVVGMLVFLPAAGGITAAQEVGIFDQQRNCGNVIGRVDA